MNIITILQKKRNEEMHNLYDIDKRKHTILNIIYMQMDIITIKNNMPQIVLRITYTKKALYLSVNMYYKLKTILRTTILTTVIYLRMVILTMIYVKGQIVKHSMTQIPYLSVYANIILMLLIIITPRKFRNERRHIIILLMML